MQRYKSEVLIQMLSKSQKAEDKVSTQGQVQRKNMSQNSVPILDYKKSKDSYEK